MRLCRAIGLLPKYFHSQWSSCKFHLPEHTSNICAFGPNSDTNRTVISTPDSLLLHFLTSVYFPIDIALCSDGSYSRFLITPKGECVQDQCRQFLEVDEDGSNLTGATPD